MLEAASRRAARAGRAVALTNPSRMARKLITLMELGDAPIRSGGVNEIADSTRSGAHHLLGNLLRLDTGPPTGGWFADADHPGRR